MQLVRWQIDPKLVSDMIPINFLASAQTNV